MEMVFEVMFFLILGPFHRHADSLMRVDEAFTAVRMLVTAINVTYPGIGQSHIGDDLTELEKKTHRLTTHIAVRFVRILNEHRVASLVGNLPFFEVIAI